VKRIVQSVWFSEDAAEIGYRDEDESSPAEYFTHALGLGRDIFGQEIDHLEEETAALLTSILGEVVVSPVPRSAFVRPSLTRRELEVLTELASGDTLPVISKRTYAGVSTLKTHITSLHNKFGTKNRTQLVLAAIRFGFVPL
jgi:DNA-binding CsgD family transcriptional regulator